MEINTVTAALLCEFQDALHVIVPEGVATSFLKDDPVEDIPKNVIFDRRTGSHNADTRGLGGDTPAGALDDEAAEGDPFRGTDPRTRARLSAKGQTRKVGLSYTHDTRDNIFSTHQGIYVKPTWEIAGLGGDFSFQKQSLEAREFFKFGSGTLGFRERVGMGSGDIPIYEQWRLGGVQSVRGIPEDMLQGTHHLLLNGEYRVPFNDTVGGVAFMDAGWAGNGFDEMDNAVSAGLGARIKLSFLGVNAVRLDYAWQIAGDKEDHGGSRFHFFLGEMF